MNNSILVHRHRYRMGGSPFVFAQPDTLRRSKFGLHFILAQTRPTAKCRLAQTLYAGLCTLNSRTLRQRQCTSASAFTVRPMKPLSVQQRTRLALAVLEQRAPALHQAAAFAAHTLARVLQSHQHLYSVPSLGLRITSRSTGPIAAGRHLGYKSLAQIPARLNRPVSLYVRPRSPPFTVHHYS